MSSGADRDVKRLMMLPTGNVCDALTEMGYAPMVMRGMRSIGSAVPFAGPAFTLRQLPRSLDVPPGVNATRHAKVIDELAQPDHVLVIDVGGYDEVCTFGAILVLRAKLRGLAGVVTDGAARDVDEIAGLGLPVHVKAVNPIGSKVFFQTVSIGQPIGCGGVQVRPGDVVFGDATGILVLPPALLSDVVERAEAVRRQEAKWLAAVRDGKSLMQAQREAAEP